MVAQLAVSRSARRTSPGARRSHIRRSRLTSPCPLPAYRAKPRFTTAPQAREMRAPRRAIGNPWPGPWLYTWGYSAWLAGVSAIVTVVRSNRYTRRPRHRQPGSARASSRRPTPQAAVEKKASGSRWRARQ